MTIKSLLDIPAIASYLHRIGGEPRSMRTAVVRINSGQYWKDIANIYFDEHGTVKCNNDQFLPTATEEEEIYEQATAADWPQYTTLKRINELPQELKGLSSEDIFEFKNKAGDVLMLQERGDGTSYKYRPWTFWSDGQWRSMEPDGELPLYNLDKLGDNTTVFIHEGAKSARHVQWMIEGKTLEAREALKAFPWGEEMKGAVHLGWIGGATNPHRTDWSPLGLNGVTRAYIVADNDMAGKKAAPELARRLNMITLLIQFTEEWNATFDMADEWPSKMFATIGDKRFYNGPSFRSCLHPATFATDKYVPAKGKPIITLRDHFNEMWAYVEEADMYVCTEMPEILRSEKILNNMLRPFSDVEETSKLLLKSFRGRQTKLCYRPDVKGRIITNKSTASINLHVPSAIKPVMGDASPFLEFMDYLFVRDTERDEALRWCATLIAQPGVHMEYGMLLVSENQGIGKTTLGTAVLAPLVGDHNVSFPGEKDISGSEFNEWLAHKRLAIVNEIYSGHSWKAYNALKSYITDHEITVNQKFVRSYTIENWCHIFACSNSLRALKMEDDDRRWFYPEINEHKWPREKFVEFRSWLAGGGLNIVMHWAKQFGKYVMQGERAPMTARKKELIEGSRSDAQREVVDLARALINFEQPAALAMKDVEQWARTSVKGKMFDSDYELRKVMKEEGAMIYDKRIMVSGRLQYAIMNNGLERIVANTEAATEKSSIVVKSIRRASDLLALNM